MEELTCPICGSNECNRQFTTNAYFLIRCKLGYTFGIADDINEMPDELQDKIYNLIFEYLLHNPMLENKYWYFFYEPGYQGNNSDESQYVNLADAVEGYPSNFIERANRTLVNLAILHPRYGDPIGVDYIDVHTTYCIGEDDAYEASGFFELMVELEYLQHQKEFSNCYVISANGWKKVDEFKRQQQEINQGFIAMSFSNETLEIREAFKKAINSSGFIVRVIDEKEHNNQIVPEIFYEIKRSKFVVVDVTYPNYGAYYEAGFAQGIGKEVIVCCKKEVFENKDGNLIKPHFDISQKSMVIWESSEDLINRLMRRIKATVN